jgi:hypothetical protein
VEEFILKNYSLFTRFVEVLSAITGILLFKKYKLTAVKYFIYFLCYLSIGDFFSNYTKLIKNNGILSFLEGTVLEENYWWSTLFWKIGAILFFVFFYNKILKTYIYKTILKPASYFFLLISVSYILLNWDQYFTSFFPIISVLGAVIIFLCVGFYFMELLQSDKILIFYKSIYFYISVAIFIWWLIITPIVFYDIYGENRDLNYLQLRRLLYLFANIFMYSTFTFALIWCKPQND